MARARYFRMRYPGADSDSLNTQAQDWSRSYRLYRFTEQACHWYSACAASRSNENMSFQDIFAGGVEKNIAETCCCKKFLH